MRPGFSPPNIRPVILCGGAGTRLWPLARQSFPKHFLPLLGEESLLQQTARRLSGDRFSPAVAVSGEDQRCFIKRQLEEVGASVDAIILEPEGRNTSAAAAVAAMWLAQNGTDELLLLVPSDHIIEDREAFLVALGKGIEHAERGGIVTFGIDPTEASTQYGYIEAAIDQNLGDGAYPIARFIEKPDRATAADYLSSGRFFWNAGIFLVKTSTLLREMREFLPSSLEAITRAVALARRDGLFVRPDPALFSAAQNISLDHGIMEKTPRGVVVPVQMEWSDVGSWDAVWRLADKDSAGNAFDGEVVGFDNRNSLLRNQGGPLVTAVGLDSMAVVATCDAVLIAPLDRAADVKEVVERLPLEGRNRDSSAGTAPRPFGNSATIAIRPTFRITRVLVDPGEIVRGQNREWCGGHWIVVRGTTEMTVDGTSSLLCEDESTFVAAGTPFSIANRGEDQLELLHIHCATATSSGARLMDMDFASAKEHEMRGSPR